MTGEAPSLDATLTRLEPGELLRLRDRLRDVVAMPGWHELMLLVDGESARARRVAEHVERWQPRGLDGLIRHQAAEGHTVGYLKGLAEIRRVTERVEQLADAVARAMPDDE